LIASSTFLALDACSPASLAPLPTSLTSLANVVVCPTLPA
jgi:hypothetical protein